MHPLIAETMANDLIADRHAFAARRRRLRVRVPRILAVRPARRLAVPAASPGRLRT
jgi:hypothetical protein